MTPDRVSALFALIELKTAEAWKEAEIVRGQRDRLAKSAQVLAKIGNVILDYEQYRKAPDDQPIMGWDDAQLTLGDLRNARAALAELESK